MEAASIDEAKAFLYGLAVESFVAERDLLVKEIRGDGDRELANRVKALRKPSAVAALVNQVVRADPDGVELILQAAGLLRSAQAGALDGAAINASELQQQYRAAVGALAQSAPARHAEVRAALEAATIDEASNQDLRTGCLVVVPTPVSMFGGSPVAEASDRAAAGADAPDAEAPTDELGARRAKRQAATDAKRKAKPKQASSNQAEAERAAEQFAEAERAAEVERLRKQADKARQKELKAVRKQHRDAVRSHLAALDAEQAASTALDEADQGLVVIDQAIADEVARAEQAMAELVERRDQAATDREHNEQAIAQAQEQAEAAELAVGELAEALASLEESAD